MAIPPASAAQRAPTADYRWAIRPLGGDEIRLERFEGEVLFINLWASWCRPCVAELGSIERLRAELVGVEGIRFLMISPEGQDRVREFLRRHPYGLPFYTEAQRMPPAFGLRALPTTYVVDRGGRVVLVHRGAADWNTERMRDFLRRTAAR